MIVLVLYLEKKMNVKKLLGKPQVIGIVADVNEGKSMLLYNIIDDLKDLIKTAPEVIVVGAGVSGGVKPDKNLETELAKLSIKFIAAPNEEAIRIFNALVSEKRVGAGFHLTC